MWPPRWLNGKESTFQCRRGKRHKFDPRLGRSLGVGNGNPLLYSCLESPMGKEAWWAVVHRVAKLGVTEQLSVCVRTHTTQIFF